MATYTPALRLALCIRGKILCSPSLKGGNFPPYMKRDASGGEIIAAGEI